MNMKGNKYTAKGKVRAKRKQSE